MSRRRKHLGQSSRREVQQPEAGQQIVRALGSRGDNLVEVEFPDGRILLALLPARFNKKLWIRKGGFLIVDEEEAVNKRINTTIAAVLFQDDVKELQSRGCWPIEFSTAHTAESSQPPKDRNKGHASDTCHSDDDDLPPLEPNSNRQVLEYDYEDEDTSDESDA